METARDCSCLRMVASVRQTYCTDAHNVLGDQDRLGANQINDMVAASADGRLCRHCLRAHRAFDLDDV